MTFDRTVTIEPETGRAVLWADTLAGARFRVVIDSKYAIDLWGLRRPVDARKFVASIREHMDEIIKQRWQPTPMASLSCSSIDVCR